MTILPHVPMNKIGIPTVLESSIVQIESSLMSSVEEIKLVYLWKVLVRTGQRSDSLYPLHDNIHACVAYSFMLGWFPVSLVFQHLPMTKRRRYRESWHLSATIIQQVWGAVISILE